MYELISKKNLTATIPFVKEINDKLEMLNTFWGRIIIVCCSIILVSCSSEETIDFSDVNISSKIIAHRGSWAKDGLPQNSRAALQAALALNLYGVEFDVRQTKDGVLVINHDAIFGDMKIGSETYEDLSLYKLNNGEILPTLEDFLSIYQGSNQKVRLIIELKNCNPLDIVELVNRYDIRDRVDYISFSRSYCDKLVELGYASQVLYLGGDISPDEIIKLGYSGIDYQNTVFYSHPEWITRAKDLGLRVFVWTVNSIPEIQYFIEKELIITTDRPC